MPAAKQLCSRRLGTFCEVPTVSAGFGGFSAATATGRTHQLKYFSSSSNPFLIGEELQNVIAIHSLRWLPSMASCSLMFTMTPA